MPLSPIELTLELRPASRFDVIDVLRELPEDNTLGQYPHALYCSSHTTAGYLEQGLVSRLNQTSTGIRQYIHAFQALFPEGAHYRHDELHLRKELSENQRAVEPRNADAHLAFIAAGLRTCVKYANQPGRAVYFLDLDGIHGERARRRQTRILGFNSEEVVIRERVVVPMSSHALESVNLKSPELGLYARMQELIASHGVTKGRIRLGLAPHEHQAGLTINEYETLLMRHDLADVLRDPLRFVYEKGRHIWTDPWAIPGRTIDYARYDFVRVFNQLCDALRMNESLVEKLAARLVGLSARHFLRMKRSVSLLVSDRESPGYGTIAEGPYQCPILVQWRKSTAGSRLIDVTVSGLV